MKLAIIGGISDYFFQQKLNACANDAATMRAFLDATKTYSDICFLDRATTGTAAKKSISEFVQKHRGSPVEELLFYFSGHGDRTDDDFFYALSDYKIEKREGSGLRNSELDSLIRNLAPELTVKIVDACYSGSTYIKSEDDIGPVVQKSAKENNLKKLYFFHSSAADQTSIAGPQFSWFTQAVLQSLANQTGAVRYRDLLAAVADEMNQRGGPRPTFVVQADSLEVFVHMDAPLADLLSKALAAPTPAPTDAKDSAELSNEDLVEITPTVQTTPVSLAKLAAAKAKDIYCTQEEAEKNVRILTAIVSQEIWPDRIKDVYEIQFREHESSEIPNKISIARWINSLKEDSVFAVPQYNTETYKAEEYREMPKKPSSLGVLGRSNRDFLSSFRQLLVEDKEYKLETVEKKRQVLYGFEYTVDPVFKPHIVYFVPKFSSMEEYAACVVCLFSRRLLTCLYSVEHLPYKAWNIANPPLAPKWKQHSAPLKNAMKIEELVQSMVEEICDFIETDARQRLA
jgi:hypothetical protein